MTEDSAVKVCVRVRPLIAREESAGSETAEPVQLFWKTDKKSIHQIDDGNSTKTFSFDRVFTADETTDQLYQDIAKPLVVSTVEGYNGTIFAYGQTSSGKTFTMMGSDHIPGVIPLAVEDVFKTIKNCPKKEFLLRVSYMEIYNETVTDLLVSCWKRKPLEVRETINKNIYVADLTEELVTSPAQALAWIRKGEKNRHYGKTKMNQRSSRSHTIFRMILESRERSDLASGESADGAIIVSHLNLVDLAGSERASQTGAEGTRFKEGCNINRSLFTLGQVIKKVTEENQKGFTNYRDSKLTRILQNSLGGNAKTVIICTITPVTLEETLSTLQFASTAKKMKNDPHVTEVSDDGALLKRYRDEIVDLKQRLHEVSSVTQTTVTEKEVLSQLLHEKEHLQREQADRIRNLTKLIVTSSNLVPVQKMPKRRVTWGGKMLRLATSSACGGSTNLSSVEAFPHKRIAVRSSLMELTEDYEEFDAHWEMPDEPSDDMEMSQSSVTVQSFGDSPKDYASPDWMRDLPGKVSNLELQLEMERQQKEEAMTKGETLEGRVAELELQLQTEAQHEALEKVQTEESAAELEQQQQSKVQQELEAMEKMLMLELRVADLERQLEEQSHGQAEYEQIRREFAETIQLCETLASEKDTVVAERDYLKQELGMFIEQIERLEKEIAALSQELEEKRELDEFKSLEEEFKKEQELQVQKEISTYKKVIESTEVKCQELQDKVYTLSEEIQKKTESTEKLQRMSGEDLVQEVAKLRRSLDDAEGLSRDTKKEWAVLRSQNIALEEMKITLTLNLEKIQAEVSSLHSHLEIEKSRYKKMEGDLQKELTVTFEENTKLNHLLDGKVPKDMIDRVEFERKVATLSEELAASRKAEGAARAQLEELASFQMLPNKVENLMKQLKQQTNVLQCVQAEKEALLSEQKPKAQTSAEEMDQLLSTLTSVTAERDQLKMDLQENVEIMIENQEELRTALEKNRKQKELLSHLETIQTDFTKDGALSEMCAQLEDQQNHIKTLTDQVENAGTEREALLFERKASFPSSKELKEKLLCRGVSVTEERDQLQETLQELRQEKQQLRAELGDKVEALQCEVKTLTEKLEITETERDSLLCEKEASFQSSSLEKEMLLCRVTSLCEERDQLQETLQELKQEKEQLKEELEDKMETLQCEMNTLTEKLEITETERDSLLCEKEASFQSSSLEKEMLLCRVTSLCEERDQLQETLQELRQEKQQFRAELEDKMATLQCEMNTLTEKLEITETERDSLLCEKEASFQSSSVEKEKLLCRVTSLCEERDQLQETLQELKQEKQQLKTELEDKMETLQCEMLSEERGSVGVEVMVSSRLNDSTRQLQETFRGFQHFIDMCSRCVITPVDQVLRLLSARNHDYQTSLPEATMSAYTAICQLGLESAQTLRNIVLCLQVKAKDCQNRFDELLKKDLAIFEERRLQDVLLCRVQALSLSVKDKDLNTVLELRLTELLDKRQLYQQKMSVILEKFRHELAFHPKAMLAEVTGWQRFRDQLEGAIRAQPNSDIEFDSLLSRELDRTAAVAHSKKMFLQGITAEGSFLIEELKLLEAQTCLQLREEKSKSSTLLQAIEGAPLKSEVSLLKDNQNLLTQLKHTEEEVKTLHVQNEQLKEAEIKAKNMLSSQKEATQLLQTELQDSRAQNDEKEKKIQTLQESKKRASPSAAELENLQTKLFKMEVELSSASDKHQQEIQRMSTVLNVKEESLRNLKETLRRLQQQGEESFLQGEDLHSKLTNPRGLVNKSSILLDKAKLEKEVKQLCLKITELECLVSTQQTEISKWKCRAINLKAKGKVELDKPSSPCTTTKRGPPETSDSSSSPKKFLVTSRKILESPRKVVDFPKVYQLDSPKSRFFDVGGSSDLLSRTCPKQFFDNSSLGTIPDAAAGPDAARKDEGYPQSPKQEDMCKTQ